MWGARGKTARRSCRGCSLAREAAATRAAPAADRVSGGGQPAEQPRQRQTARSTYAPATYAADASADEFKRQQLVQMGFDTQRAAGALVFAGGDVACSAALLRAWAEWELSLIHI